MKSTEIREKFLTFFQKKGHKVVSSAPMVIKDDPTLMFTNAGMNQFKDYFLGDLIPDKVRVCDTQKCLRVSGKHNDLDEVGYDTYHHTMFEMLGNWSFGDYFKKDAISWAWELLIDVYGIDKDRLYVTVFEGAKEDQLEKDTEAYEIWSKLIDNDRIIDGNKKDNFWEMGEIGPCGPCSEIHIDLRPDDERSKIDGKTLVNMDHPLVIEVWNLVFMQFNRLSTGNLEKLPQTHVDTGMGFERLCMALQGVQSNYDTDLFQPIIKMIASISSKRYGINDDIDVAMRVIADHLRAISFSIADGQIPSNSGAGYVIRRILRRAVRYGFTFLNMNQPFIYRLVDILIETIGQQFRELEQQSDLIKKVIKEEEASFLKTLEKGIKRFESIEVNDNKTVSGSDAFEMYDTYGFPIDLTQLLAQEKGWVVNLDEFNSHLDQQKSRSRQATQIETGDWIEIFKDEKEEFIGYDFTSSKIKISRYRSITKKGQKLYQLVFNFTPFYAEGGGQVGDTGYIEDSGVKTNILDTKKENNLIVHFVDRLPSNLEATFNAQVDEIKREEIANNHTATHLLHKALRDVLGDHVEQKGSLVNSNYLRFDFSHFSKLEDEEILLIENTVNQYVKDNHQLEEFRSIPMEQAKKLGAMALFGEKYGDVVRAIKFADSIELCGGIHVPHTSKIGLFKITSEGAVASGIRRIEAITSDAALQYYNQSIEKLKDLKKVLKSNDVLKAIEDLILENQKLEKKIDQYNIQKAVQLKSHLQENLQDYNGIDFIAYQTDLDAKSIKSIAFDLTNSNPNLVLALASSNENKVTLTIAVSKQLAEAKGINAGLIIREASKEINGGGGGQAFFATAGGKNPKGIDNAFEKIKSFLI